jgi:hypothetical protein
MNGDVMGPSHHLDHGDAASGSVSRVTHEG